MLNNAGNKIIFWSKVVLAVGIALSLVLGFFIIWHGAQANNLSIAVYRSGYFYNMGFMSGGRAIVAGFLVIALGSLGSWLIALLLRAFGDLTADTRAVRERLECLTVEMEAEEPAEAKPAADKKPAKAKAADPAKPGES